MENYDNFDILEIDSARLYNKEEKDFVFTSLFLNDFDIKDKKIFVNYIDEIAKYQIFVCNKKSKYFIIDIFRVFYLEKEDLNTIDLFINESFFLVYKKGIFLYFQNITSSFTKEELKDFVENKLNIKIDNIYIYEQEDIEKLEEKYIKNNLSSSFKDLNKAKINSFHIFIFFTLALILGLVFYYDFRKNLYKVQEKEKLDYIKNEKLLYKKEFEYKYVYTILDKLFKNLKSLKLKIDKLEFNNKNMLIEFTSKNKEDIYTFLSTNKSKIKSNIIVYDEKNKVFKVRIDVYISRR